MRKYIPKATKLLGLDPSQPSNATVKRVAKWMMWVESPNMDRSQKLVASKRILDTVASYRKAVWP